MKFSGKKIFKWILYLLALVIIFVGGIFIMLQYLFPSSFLISKIESYMKDNYNLGVKIDKLDFTLMSGISIKKFSFTDNDMPDSLFSMESFTLKYELWPLLDKKLVVKTIVLNHPKVNIVKNAEGKFNFDGIIEKFKGKEEPPPPESAEPESTGAKFVVSLKNLELNNIDLSYEDRSPDNPMKVKLPLYSIKLSGVRFVDMNDYKADLKFVTGERNELVFKDNNNSVSLFQDMDLNVEARNENIDATLSHKIKDLKLHSEAVNIENSGDIDIKLSAYYNLKTDSIDVRSFGFYLGDMFRTELKGTIASLSAELKVAANVSEISADLEKLAAFTEANKLADLQGAAVKGSKLKFSNLELEYKAAENFIKASGILDFSAIDMSYRQKDISAFVKYLMINSGFALTMKDNKLLASSVDLSMELESINANVSGKKYSTGRQSLTVNPVLKSDFMPESVKLDYKITDIAEGGITLLADATFDLSDTSIPGLIRNTKAEISLTADKIHPNTITDAAPDGLFVTLSEELKYADGIVENTLDVSTEYNNETASMYSAADGIDISTFIKADISGHPKEKYKLIDLTAKINDFLSADIKDVSADLKAADISIGKFNFDADLDELLRIGKATGIPQIQNTRLYNGSLNISAEGGGNLTKQESTSELRLKMSIDSLYHDDIAVKKGIKVNQTVNLLTKDVSLIGDITLAGADFAGMLKEMGIEGNAKLENNIRYTEAGEIRILKLGLSVPALETELSVKGTANLKDSVNTYDLDVTHSLGLKDKYPFVKGIRDIKGKISGTTKLKGNMNTAAVEHTESLKNTGLLLELDSLGNTVKLININADIPFSAKLDIKNSKLISYSRYEDIKDYDYLNYTEFRSQYKMNGVPVSNLRIDTVSVNHKLFKNSIKNIDMDIYFDNNKFCLNRFYYELFDGNTAGFLRLDIGEGGFDDIIKRANLDLGLTMTGLNTYYLNRKKTKHSPSTEMNVIVKLNSKGLDIVNEPDLNGEINISKLSGDDAQYLLEFLNKNSGDQTAGMVKKMLNAFPGIKVDLFSFTIKNNFLYTLIKLKKPWYLVYFPLSEQISLSKQSLKFYLDKYVKEDL